MKNSKIPERFFTPSDRIRDLIKSIPDISYTEAEEQIRIRFNVTFTRQLFYRVKSEYKYKKKDKRSKEDCYRDLVDLLHEYGDCTIDLIELLESYSNETLITQLKVIRSLIESKS